MGCGCQGKKKQGPIDMMAPAAAPAGIAYQLVDVDGNVELYDNLADARASKLEGDTIQAVRRPSHVSLA